MIWADSKRSVSKVMGIGPWNISAELNPIPVALWSSDGIAVKPSAGGYVNEGEGEQDGELADPGVSARKPP
jgi:hypothetical protein